MEGSLAANAPLLLDASLQKSTDDFFMRVPDHFCSEGLVFCTNMTKHCNNVMRSKLPRVRVIKIFVHLLAKA